MKHWILSICLLMFSLFTNGQGCFCPDFSELNVESCSRYESILQVQIESVENCPEGILKVKVLNAFKGDYDGSQDVLIKCDNDGCLLDINKDEEWIFYLKKNNAQDLVLEFCSPSRKILPENVEDVLVELTGRTYYQELSILKELFPFDNNSGVKNLELPKYEKVDPINIPLFLSVSLIFMVVGYFVMNKVFKK